MAVITIVASDGPVGPGEVAAGGTITVVPGDTYVFSADADANTTFETSGGSETFEVRFEAENLNSFDVTFSANTNPQITITDDVSLPSVQIDARDAQSVEFTAGNGVTLEEYKGSDTGADTIRIGDDFTTPKNFVTGGGNDDVEIGSNATMQTLNLSDGNNTVTIGSGLSADNIEFGGGNNAVTICDLAQLDDIKTGHGDNFISIGDGLIAHNIDTGDGTDRVIIGENATLNDIKTDKGDDTIVIGNGLTAHNIETGDGSDSVTIGDAGTLNDLKTGDGNDTVVIGDDFTADRLEAWKGDDYVRIGAGGVVTNTLDGGDGLDTLASSTDFPDATNFDTIVCFVAGTRIATAQGTIPVERLRAGDLVATLDHGLQPVRWVGSTTVAGRGRSAPVRIAAKSLGNRRDLLVSPQHRILIDGWRVELVTGQAQVLVAAKNLVNGTTIRQVETGRVTYVHVMFDSHEIIFSEGVPSESFHPGAIGMGSFPRQTQQEILTLFPCLRTGLSAYGPSARRGARSFEARAFLADGWPGGWPPATAPFLSGKGNPGLGHRLAGGVQ